MALSLLLDVVNGVNINNSLVVWTTAILYANITVASIVNALIAMLLRLGLNTTV